MTWNENDHPRDEIGRFTFKDGGVVETLKGGVEKTEGNSILSNILEKLNLTEVTSVAIDVLGKIATPAIKLYSNANDLINLIKINKLEDKFNIALQNTIREKEKNIKNISSVNNKNSNKEYKVNNIKYSSKIKEDSINFLGSDKRKNNNIESDFKQNKKYKDVLLDILGNKATPADILYGTKEKLEKKIKEYGLEDRLEGIFNNEKSNIGNNRIKKGIDVRDMYERKIQLEKKIPHQIVNSILQLGIESATGKLGYVTKIHEEVKKLLGLDTAGMLDLAHEKRNEPSYTKDAIELKNFNDPRVALDKKYLAEKLYSQFQNEYTKITNIENIKGYFFKSNSEPSQRIANNDDFRKTIRQNKNKILKGEKVTMEFPNYGYNQKSNLHYALGHIDIRNGYIDKEGNLRIKVYDTYDFNKTNPTPANQAGRNQMLKGNLKPFFTIHDIIIPKKDINELWK